MSPASLLTEAEHREWRDIGYLTLRGAVPAGRARELSVAVDETLERYKALPRHRRIEHSAVAGIESDYRIKNLLALSDRFDWLLDWEPIYRRVLGLMGPYIALCATEILVRTTSDRPALQLHVDGGPSLNRILPSAEGATMFVKALVFLTPVRGEDQGNLELVPGSHRELLPASSDAVDEHSVASRRMQVLVEPGDVVLFPWSLWHAVAPNRTESPRVALALWYCQRWIRPVDRRGSEEVLLSRLSPRQRLLVQPNPPNGSAEDFYMPSDERYLATMVPVAWKDSPELSPYRVADATYAR